MTQSVALRTTLITSFTLLACNAIVCAQDGFTAVAEDGSVLIGVVEPVTTSTNEMPAEQNVDQSDSADEQPGSPIAQAQPGERVTNPNHLILNLDTMLGGVEIKGTSSRDYGYLGPGDMRTHLWNGHANELIENGITENKLMAMTVPEVQKWHNYFHGAEGSPEHSHDDDEHSHLDTIVQQPAMPSSLTYVDESGYGTVVYEAFDYDISEYPQSVYDQSEIIYEDGVIFESSTAYEFEDQFQSTFLDHGVIQSGSIGR